MSFARQPVKLLDCHQHGVDSDAELLVVEGDSAAKAVWGACNRENQAVLPMQGKPMNACKASLKAVAGNELFLELCAALGFRIGQVVNPCHCRFRRLILLFDPDADGIHCGALLLLFIERYLEPLLAAGQVGLVRAPLFRFQVAARTQPEFSSQVPAEAAGSGDATHQLYAYSESEAQRLVGELKSEGYTFRRQHFRGLASLGEELLENQCLNPATRRYVTVSVRDAEAARQVFGGVDR